MENTGDLHEFLGRAIEAIDGTVEGFFEPTAELLATLTP
jgi:hypothetical protein